MSDSKPDTETLPEGIRRDPDGTEWLQITSDSAKNGERFWRMLERYQLTSRTKPREKASGEQQVEEAEKATDQEERLPEDLPVQLQNERGKKE